jgi:hypothetical protein
MRIQPRRGRLLLSWMSKSTELKSKYQNRNRTSISWPRLRERANYGKNRVELAVRLHDFQGEVKSTEAMSWLRKRTSI